jgi:hypothetical protein
MFGHRPDIGILPFQADSWPRVADRVAPSENTLQQGQHGIEIGDAGGTCQDRPPLLRQRI